MFYFQQAKLVLCHWYLKYILCLPLSFCKFQVFESFGPVELVQLPHDQVTGLCKGFSFVQVCIIFLFYRYLYKGTNLYWHYGCIWGYYFINNHGSAITFSISELWTSLV
jgi:hypothetical protein